MKIPNGPATVSGNEETTVSIACKGEKGKFPLKAVSQETCFLIWESFRRKQILKISDKEIHSDQKKNEGVFAAVLRGLLLLRGGKTHGILYRGGSWRPGTSDY